MTFREALRRRARGLRARIVLPEGEDPRVQEAAATLARLEIADPIVLSAAALERHDDPRLRQVGALLRNKRPNAVKDGIHAIDLASDPLRFAAGLVALGEADGCVAGATATTADVLRAALWAIGPADGATVSAAMYLGLPSGTVLTFVDIAVIPSPTPEQLAGAARAAASERRALVGDEPRVAFLSYSTHGSATGPEVERVREAAALFRAMEPDVAADGELQADAALDAAVAAAKAPGSPVAGAANVLVFPSLDAGNIAYKLVQRLANASAIGPIIQGLRRPCSDLSRGAVADDIINVAAITALQVADAPSIVQHRIDPQGDQTE